MNEILKGKTEIEGKQLEEVEKEVIKESERNQERGR